jgi:DNA-binding XRE family transcriptional regulator
MNTHSHAATQFPALLRRWREKNGYSQQQAASVLGVSQGSVGQWESGRRSPTLDAATMPGIIRIFQECGLVSGPVEMPEGISLQEVESMVLSEVRAVFKQAREKSSPTPTKQTAKKATKQTAKKKPD